MDKLHVTNSMSIESLLACLMTYILSGDKFQDKSIAEVVKGNALEHKDCRHVLVTGLALRDFPSLGQTVLLSRLLTALSSNLTWRNAHSFFIHGVILNQSA